MLALEAGDVTPERWVPNDIASYQTLHWDIETTYKELTELYELFRGPDAWQQEIVDRVSQRLGIDLQTDVVDALDGRGTMLTWIERPARINSQARLVGLKLKDSEESKKTLQQAMSRFSNRFETKTYGGVTYYFANVNRRRPQNENPAAQLARRPTPCIAILGNYLVATDSEKLLQHAIVTKSDASLSLANELDFKLITNKIKRQLGDTKAGMIGFNRPEEGFRLLYELATSKTTQTRLADQAENNGFFRALDGALHNNPLPPFAVLAQYLAPGGSLLTNDETGIHYMAFGLKRE